MWVVTCGQITEYIREVYRGSESFLLVKLDQSTISSLQLEVNAANVVEAITNAPKLKLKLKEVKPIGRDMVQVFVGDRDKRDRSKSADRAGGERGNGDDYNIIQQLKQSLPRVIVKVGILGAYNARTGPRAIARSHASLHAASSVVVAALQGIPTVNRAVVNTADVSAGTYNLLVEGYGLRAVMATEGAPRQVARAVGRDGPPLTGIARRDGWWRSADDARRSQAWTGRARRRIM